MTRPANPLVLTSQPGENPAGSHNAGQRLVFTKGYEQMSIQDILDDVRISSGAFHHYFDSRRALLEAFIKRIKQEAEKLFVNLALLVFCEFDHRFAWSPVPAYVSVLGDVLVALGLLIDLFVFRENSYGGSTIEIVEGQKVISSGLYARIRHPMYTGVIVMIIGVPLALGSWWGLAVLALTIPVLIVRILDEEKLLSHDLPGYREYTQKVRYRLVPYLW